MRRVRGRRVARSGIEPPTPGRIFSMSTPACPLTRDRPMPYNVCGHDTVQTHRSVAIVTEDAGAQPGSSCFLSRRKNHCHHSARGLSWPVAVDVIKRQKLECFLMAAGTTNASAAVMQKCLRGARDANRSCGLSSACTGYTMTGAHSGKPISRKTADVGNTVKQCRHSDFWSDRNVFGCAHWADRPARTCLSTGRACFTRMGALSHMRAAKLQLKHSTCSPAGNLPASARGHAECAAVISLDVLCRPRECGRASGTPRGFIAARTTTTREAISQQNGLPFTASVRRSAFRLSCAILRKSGVGLPLHAAAHNQRNGPSQATRLVCCRPVRDCKLDNMHPDHLAGCDYAESPRWPSFMTCGATLHYAHERLF